MAGTDEEEVATEVAGYVVLPLALEKLPSYPVEATHYLYIRAHEPKVPDQDSARSWYVVNTPTNATEGAMRALLADQLGGTLVDRVDFEDDRTAATTTSNRTAAKRNKPRGRVQSLDETVGDVVEAPSYPALWDRRMHKSGSSAVVVFVDRASAELALRFVRKAIKERRKVYWRPEPMPLLGPDSMGGALTPFAAEGTGTLR